MEASEFETKEEYEEHYDYDVERIAQKVSTTLFNRPTPYTIDRAEIIASMPHLMVDDLDDTELVEEFINDKFDEYDMEEAVDEVFAEREEEEEEELGDFNCVNCGTPLTSNYFNIFLNDVKIRCCDEACFRQHGRDTTRESLQKRITEADVVLEGMKAKMDSPVKTVFVRYSKIKKMLFQSMLQRKPRAELMRLVELRKKIITEWCELAHELKMDGILFQLGEQFKENAEYEIDCWCAPE